MNIVYLVFINYCMKKIHFGVIKVKRWASNIAIALIILVIGGFAIFAGVNAIPVTAVSGVYYNGDTSSNKVTLMINVYWGTEYLDDMLQILENNNVKTTFFVGGTWAVLNEDYLTKIYEAGHELANHGYHHKDHDKLDEAGNLNEISTTHKIIKELLDVDMNLFAPPSGAYDKLTVSCAESIGYHTIMWTRDTIDWRDHDANLIYQRAIKNAKGGDLILMHPTEATVQALPNIIDYFTENGFTLTTVSDNIGLV